MGGRVRSDQVLDLTQLSGSQSKCKGGFCTGRSRAPLLVDNIRSKRLNVFSRDSNFTALCCSAVWWL